jgi:hypothetical protein
MTNNVLPPLLFTALVIFATAKWVIAVEEMNRNTVDVNVAIDGHGYKEVAAGFKLERYTSLWQRNPFAAPTVVDEQVQPSLLDKLSLASWLMVGGTAIIFVQNSETNEVQKVTAETNQNNLRLVQIHLDTNPRSVQAVISNGMEQGTVKFRVDAGLSPAETVSSAGQTPNNGTAGQTPKAGVSSRALPGPQANLQNAQSSDSRSISPVVPSAPHNNYYPGVQRVHNEGGQARMQRPGKHLIPRPMLEQKSGEASNAGTDL